MATVFDGYGRFGDPRQLPRNPKYDSQFSLGTGPFG